MSSFDRQRHCAAAFNGIGGKVIIEREGARARRDQSKIFFAPRTDHHDGQAHPPLKKHLAQLPSLQCDGSGHSNVIDAIKTQSSSRGPLHGRNTELWVVPSCLDASRDARSQQRRTKQRQFTPKADGRVCCWVEMHLVDFFSRIGSFWLCWLVPHQSWESSVGGSKELVAQKMVHNS